jgi:fumarate reductase flavoprotein subunit
MKSMESNISRRGFVEGAVAAGALSAASPAVRSALAGETAEYAPGTYSAQSIGIDLMTVTMTFSETAIEDVSIDAHETLAVGGSIIPVLADSILENQSPDVDVISGASITSKAVREAARNCVAQAKGEAEPLEADDCISPIEPAGEPDAWDLESDVIIVGASVAGLTAAAKLAENGIGVTVFEKESMVGGTGRVTTCIGTYGGNGLWEGDSGYFATPYHDKDVMDYFQERARWSIDPMLLRNITVSLREVIDWWLSEDGASLAIIPDSWWCTWAPDPEGHEGTCTPATTSLLADWMQELAEKNGADFRLSNPVDALVTDSTGAVIGVKAQDPDGNPLYAKATTAVILAADSFQANPKMLEKYGGLAAGCKSALAKGNGRVIRMGQGIGAAMSGIGSFAASTSMPIVDGARALLPMRRNYDGINYVSANPWCRFDEKGKRVAFVSNEKVAELGQCNDTIDSNHRQCCQDLSRGDCFVVFDSDWLTNLDSNGVTGFRVAWKPFDCEKCMSDERRISRSWYCSDIEQAMEDSIAEGGYKRADTLEELADQLGIDQQIFLDAVSAWNKDCEDGVGDELNGYTAENMTPVANPPFYGARVTPGLYAAFAGLAVNEKNEVLDESGKVIPGVYAAFHTAGGIAGVQQQLCPVGDQIGSMCASGYNIAKAILGEDWVTV